MARVLELTDRSTEVLAAYREALVIRQELYEARPSDTVLLDKFLGAHDGLGRVLLGAGDRSRAAWHFRQELTLAERQSQLDPQGSGPVLNLWHAYRNLGQLAAAGGEAVNAQAYYARGLVAVQKLVSMEPTSAERGLDRLRWPNQPKSLINKE